MALLIYNKLITIRVSNWLSFSSSNENILSFIVQGEDRILTIDRRIKKAAISSRIKHIFKQFYKAKLMSFYFILLSKYKPYSGRY